jgi:hypothetical protein
MFITLKVDGRDILWCTVIDKQLLSEDEYIFSDLNKHQKLILN